jgi:serine/threonine-protein kinase 24/25/MST4
MPSSNQAVRQHISTTRGLFPHRRIQRNTQVTPSGIVVIEQEIPEDQQVSPPASPTRTRSASNISNGASRDDGKKSPISELLYMRWLDGLKLKWPSLL